MGLLLVLLLAFVAWMVFTQVGGRQRISVSTEHDIAEARRIVATSFAIAWTRVEGPGRKTSVPGCVRMPRFCPSTTNPPKAKAPPLASGVRTIRLLMALWCTRS